ncbi:MAG: DMT family transporter [Bacteroidia bacterium]|nr:MAG: DMT family transporter [Bacteroidia bacterium]
MVRLFRNYGAVVISMVFWSLAFIWFKIANEVYSPLTIIYMRLVISAMLLSLFLFTTRKFEKIERKDRKIFFLLAFCEPFIYFLGESFGLTYVSSIEGAVLISTIPIFTAIISWIFFKEKLRLINYAGIMLSFVGVMIFVLNRDGSLSFDLRGLALLSVAVFGAVGYTLTLKRLADSYSPVFIVNVQNIIGLILFTPVILIFDLDNMARFSYSSVQFWAIIKLALFASSGAFILFGYAVRSLGATKANVFSNAIPVFTAIFAFFLVGDVITLQKITGMAIVVTGLFLSQSHKKEWSKPDGTILAGKTG